MSRQREIQADIRAKLTCRCDDPADQATRDNLQRFDKLHAEGHPKACACAIVWGGRTCECCPAAIKEK